MSRPSSSVPSTCSPPGGSSRASSETMYGLSGARKGAKIAANTRIATITSPARAARLRRRRAQARAVLLAAGRAGARSAPSVALSAIAHARIDHAVQQVDGEVDQRYRQRRHHDDALHEGVIALADGLDQ